MKRLRTAVNEAHDEFYKFEICQAGNGLIVLSTHVLRNLCLAVSSNPNSAR